MNAGRLLVNILDLMVCLVFHQVFFLVDVGRRLLDARLLPQQHRDPPLLGYSRDERVVDEFRQPQPQILLVGQTFPHEVLGIFRNISSKHGCLLGNLLNQLLLS